MTEWALEQCTWCDSYDTDWVDSKEHHEPSLEDVPEFDPVKQIVTIKLMRYCNKCHTFKPIKMCFAIKDGWMIDYE